MQSHFNIKPMKKLVLIILAFISVTLNACSNNPAGEPGGNTITEGQVNKLTAEDFQKLVWDYKKNPENWTFKGDMPVIIDFYADWCRPCKWLPRSSKNFQKSIKEK